MKTAFSGFFTVSLILIMGYDTNSAPVTICQNLSPAIENDASMQLINTLQNGLKFMKSFINNNDSADETEQTEVLKNIKQLMDLHSTLNQWDSIPAKTNEVARGFQTKKMMLKVLIKDSCKWMNATFINIQESFDCDNESSAYNALVMVRTAIELNETLNNVLENIATISGNMTNSNSTDDSHDQSFCNWICKFSQYTIYEDIKRIVDFDRKCA